MSVSPSCPTCHHTRPNGKRCGSPALRGEQFCFYHHPTRRPVARTRPVNPPFYLPPVADQETLQMAIAEVARRIADNTLDARRARLILATLQMAKANLAPDVPAYFSAQSATSRPPAI